MPEIKSFPSRKEWEEACWIKIMESLEILGMFISAGVRHNLVLRATAANRLLAGKSYREIGDELWLSPQTISGVKKALGGSRYRSYTERSEADGRKKKYGSSFGPKEQIKKRKGLARKTKYGIVYIPNY